MKEIIFILMAFKGEIDAKYLKNELENFYNVKTKIIVEKEINNIALNKRSHRYSASEILDYQRNMYPDNPSIAITSKDITMVKGINREWGIAGLSFLGEEVSVISLFRIKNKQVAVKVLLHEFGHGQGLPHCTSKYPCFMKNAKGKLSNIGKQPKALCITCKIKLRIKSIIKL
jgi:predicted Zn-dependent protease